MPRKQAGHMTASDRQFQNAKKLLLAGGHPHMTKRGDIPAYVSAYGA
jgi:hypothetical protein